ncbi:hypothetical protein [Bradyrhizobium cenepequi]
MAQTFFQDFCKDNGLPVTVEYTYRPGSETSYSPAFGACGGDPCEIEIVNSWPNSTEFERACEIRIDLEWRKHSRWMKPFVWIALQFAKVDIWLRGLPAHLTAAERERIGVWLSVHHVYEPYEPYEPYEEDYL